MSNAPPSGPAREPSPAPSPSTPERPASPLRRRLLLGFAVLVLAVGASVAVKEIVLGDRYVETDNAYVAADMLDITPLVAAPVKSVGVVDTQAVEAGTVLVTLDDADLRLAVQQAEAALSQAERAFRQTEATVRSLQAQLAARAADVTSAEARVVSARAVLRRTTTEAERRRALRPSHTVSIEELTASETARDEAEAAVREAEAAVLQAHASRDAAEASLAATRALIDGTTLETAPDVQAARLRLAQARLDLSRAVIAAPVAGTIARKAVEVGQRVAAGQSLMRLVPLGAVYVNANFKESQLKRVRVGQPATLHADLYGSKVAYHGTVEGFAAGTGSVMALIPAQNATGNWIKVVQRLPVRVSLDPADLAAHPLRVGLSMTAEIDTGATPDAE
ncbi:HlyD family secretion protein [Pararhodospirillum oryzae]|uniref:Hemolysin D n=1 Tax=Pararhodospirillum oryzae TaxID=478448 RepID=A0A512H5T3_9PROT|nr:HlyD family efflux transporter periplasmic adaptor subunit [Pararhodospirillum oryzae]GEO80835.1 hemolysin D [Pararhodospirillum oryzae]